jgi:hypothetical protein
MPYQDTTTLRDHQKHFIQYNMVKSTHCLVNNKSVAIFYISVKPLTVITRAQKLIWIKVNPCSYYKTVGYIDSSASSGPPQ